MKMRAVFILIKIGEAQLPSNSLPLALGSDLKRQQRASWQTMDCNCRVRSWHDKDGGTLGRLQHTSLYDRDGHNQTSNNQTKMVGHCNTHQQHWNTGAAAASLSARRKEFFSFVSLSASSDWIFNIVVVNIYDHCLLCVCEEEMSLKVFAYWRHSTHICEKAGQESRSRRWLSF